MSEVSMYWKRQGTTGICGQLYEVKLAMLLLIRALNDEKLEKFSLGTNVDGLGCLDDIVFIYNLKGESAKRALFMQAKHKESPEKDKVTEERVLNECGDLSLCKYLDSYLKIGERFNNRNNDNVFEGDFRNMKCDLIYFTPAKQDFRKKDVIDNHLHFISTSKAQDSCFFFKYEGADFKEISSNFAKFRAKSLAKVLTKFHLKSSQNMMQEELIRTYHVFLAQNVLLITKKGELLEGTFRPEFLGSNDGLLKTFRDVLYSEIMKIDKHNMTSDDCLKFLQNWQFTDLPIHFGGLDLKLKGGAKKRSRRINH